jgi:hypothetical protein
VRRARTLCTLCKASDAIDQLERDIHRTASARNKIVDDEVRKGDTTFAFKMATRYREQLEFLINDVRRIAEDVKPSAQERGQRVGALFRRLEVLKSTLSACKESPSANQLACGRLETIKT